MPNVTVAASMIGQFLKGVQARQASDDQRASSQKGERMARAGQFFSMSNDLRQRSEDESQTMQERDRLRKESESLYAGGLELWGQMDAKPKAGGKKNPVMQVLQFLNPLAKRGDTGDSEFEETFSRILSGLGQPQAGGGGEAGAGAAPGITAAAPGIAAAMENPAAAGFEMGGAPTTGPPGGPVGGFSSAMQGEVGGMTAAPTAAVPGLQPRPTSILNADGTRSSERSITVEVAELNGGRPTNIPSIYDGQQLSDEQAIQIAVQNGGVDRETGRAFPAFNSNEEAVAAAGQRSDALGAAAAPGAVTPPGEPPYVSPYFRDKKAELHAAQQQVTTIFRQLRDSFQAKGIKSIADLEADPQGMQIVQHLQFLAGENDFTEFDELDEIYAGLGLQAARSPKDQFEAGYFTLAQKQASGEPMTEQDSRNLETYRKLRRLGSASPETPDQAKWQDLLRVHGGEVAPAWEEWTKATATTGTQGFRLMVAENNGQNELLRVNNRTGEHEWTGIRVSSGFKLDDVLTRNLDTGEERLDGAKIAFYHRTKKISDESLEAFLADMPDLIPYIGSMIPNPEKEILKKYMANRPKPPEASEVETIKEFAFAKEMSFDEARAELERLGLEVREPGAIGSFRRRGAEGG